MPPSEHESLAALSLEAQATRLRMLLDGIPDAAIFLGSGLAAVARCLGLAPLASYQELGLPTPGISGHIGQVSAGTVAGRLLLAFEGRSHLYEGLTLEAVTRGIRLALAADVKRIVLTNAAGGLSAELNVGDLMLIRDHISIPGLCGYSMATDAASGTYPWPRFLNQDNIYDPSLAALAGHAAREAGLHLHPGIYAMVWGPHYETPAERRLLERLGADAVGMSTVPEAIVAHAASASVLALSVITNTATSPVPPSHEEVARASAGVCEQVATLLALLVGRIGD